MADYAKKMGAGAQRRDTPMDDISNLLLRHQQGDPPREDEDVDSVNSVGDAVTLISSKLD